MLICAPRVGIPNWRMRCHMACGTNLQTTKGSACAHLLFDRPARRRAGLAAETGPPEQFSVPKGSRRGARSANLHVPQFPPIRRQLPLDMKKFDPGFAERQQTSSNAKQTLLDKVKARTADPEHAKRQEARREASAERKARTEERRAAQRAEKARKAEERAQQEAEQRAAVVAEEARKIAEAAEAEQARIELEAAQKAKRDARYAKRKARR